MAQGIIVGRRIGIVAALLLSAACARHHAQTAPAAEPKGPTPPAQASAAEPAVVANQQGAAVDRDSTKSAAVERDSTKSAQVDSLRLSANEVRRRALDVFGDSVAVAASVDSAATRESAATDSAAEAPTWDMDVRSYESTNRVEHYVQYFSGPAREHIQERLGRGTRFEPMIRRKMRAGGLPEDMYYLALIESGFDPNAYSRAAAVGMWQFMTSTARDMGMRVDWWVDERRDPVRSTSAAVRFIKGLKQQFGSLYLAAAAYNGGPGRISRGLTRYADDLEGTSGDDLFFALAEKDALKHETKEYVPQLIAAALIAKEPARYGMHIETRSPFEYDSVRVGPATPLAAIAKAAGARVSDIQELNPQILRGMTPPRDSFQVRIPSGTAAGFDSAFDALPDADRVGLKSRTTKKGQWLDDIAHSLGLSVRQLSAFNPRLEHYKSGKLVPGQRLMIPTPAVVAAAVNVPDPSIERYGSKASRLHVVKSGENLSVIAKRYHTTTTALMRLNGLKRALIFPGQTLVVSGQARSQPSRSRSARTTKPTGHAASRRKAPSGKAQGTTASGSSKGK